MTRLKLLFVPLCGSSRRVHVSNHPAVGAAGVLPVKLGYVLKRSISTMKPSRSLKSGGQKGSHFTIILSLMVRIWLGGNSLLMARNAGKKVHRLNLELLLLKRLLDVPMQEVRLNRKSKAVARELNNKLKDAKLSVELRRTLVSDDKSWSNSFSKQVVV
ncbi:hypothetical protein EYF80_031731 [Liparis tanakae]|uniref:Uncharacterized protein n=1 Tax=Liparis tanakae TaxID=230148 RepID=A0A4Z2GX81_9TELE|nr:hypothetical protein EYF80_031731 [Liparis tanakae]